MINKIRNISRRSFILGSSLAFSSVSKVLGNNIANKAHIVVVGAGWGGLSAAKTARLLNKEYKITVIEKNKKFMSCPISNWVIGQIKEIDDISFKYDNFVKNNNIDIIFDEVISINLS